jgi:hypothetical protein
MADFIVKNGNGKVVTVKKDFFLQGLVKESFRNRLWITVVTLFTFLLIIFGIGHSLIMGTELAQEWKEILLLVLGAFIGSYNRVIDFWFNASERDKEMIARADHEDDEPGQTFEDHYDMVSGGTTQNIKTSTEVYPLAETPNSYSGTEEYVVNPSTEWVDDREPMVDEDYNDKK